MAKSSQALLVAALCFFGVLAVAYSHDLVVKGEVYCDTCRVMFPTFASTPVANLKVTLECRSRENGAVTYIAESLTDENGDYEIPVDGEHADDICEAIASESPIADCNEVIPGRDRARVVLTANNGIVSTERLANSLGFLKKEPLESCPKVLEEMGLLPTVDLSI